MRKISLTLFIMTLFGMLLTTNTVFTQSLSVKFTDPSNYPEVVTAFMLKDKDSNRVSSFQNSDIIIEEADENGVPNQRPIINVDCPDQALTTFSAVLCVDISTSMDEKITGGASKIDVVKQVLKEWITKFNPLRTETAITAFCADAIPNINDPSKPIHEFSTNKSSLMDAVDNLPSLCAGTNWNAAFLVAKDGFTEKYSALHYCKPDVAKYKPVIIFLTDGNHINKWSKYPGNESGVFDINRVRMLANARNTTIYVIQIGDEAMTQENSGYLQQLSEIGKDSNDNSPNIWLGVTDAGTLSGIYQQILAEAGSFGYPPPCYVTWLSECSGGSATMTLPNNGALSGTTKFVIDNAKKPSLDISPRIVPTIKDVAPPATKDIKITLTARNNYLIIDSTLILKTIRGNGKYEIKDWGLQKTPPIRIEKDSSYDITVRYTPTDSLYSMLQWDLMGTACSDREMTLSAEMLPFVEKIDMGDVAIGGSDQKTFSKVFCNKTGKKIRINNIKIKDGDAGDFSVVSPTGTFDLDSGDCVEVVFKFTPTEPAGKKSATIEFDTNYDGGTNFENEIFGNGIGGKVMSSTNPGFDSTDCNLPSVESDIILENTGNIALNISKATILPDETNFEIKNGQFPTTIGAKSQETITIIFHPAAIQNADYTATLEIESDAKNSPYDIDLIGPMKHRDFSLSGDIDFGQVCVGNPATEKLTITNTGNVEFPVTVSVNPPFKVATANYLLSVGGSADVDIVCDPQSDAPLSDNVTITIDDCGTSKTAALTAMAAKPLITLDKQINLSATIGNSDALDITVTNSSTSPLNVASITPTDATRFTITNINPALPTNIAPGGTLTFKITYQPQSGDANLLNSTIEFTGSTCNFDTLVAITGNPGLATVNIELDEYTGYDGQNITFNLFLRNGINFDQSNTSLVSVDIRYDGTLLEAQPPLVESAPDANGFKTISLKDLACLAQNTEQNIAALNFKVHQTGSNISTPLEILNPAGNGGASFIANNGLFTLNPASASIYIDSTSAQPGEDFNIPIKIKYAKNLENAENILLDLSFNSTIIEAKNSNIIQNKKFSEDFTSCTLTLVLPVSGPNDILGKIPCKAKLGTATESNLNIEKAWVKVGGANISRFSSKFRLLNVCKDGNQDNYRFFDPTNKAAILALKPNPASTMVTVEYETAEKASTKMWVSNLLGSKVIELFNYIPEPGISEIDFNISQLGEGVYFIMMQTPTQLVRKKLFIIK